MKNFVKISGFWYEYDASTPPYCSKVFYEDDKGHFFLDITCLEKVEADKIEELDWHGSIILNNEYRTGWLSPEGVFYGCEAYHHKQQAKFIHKKDELMLEKEGWIRINYNLKQNGEKHLIAGFGAEDITIYPTKEQLKYLLKKYADNANLFYDMWTETNKRKELIQEEWGLN